jgi:cytochrome b6-f complex iron-sulfur subunit
LSLKEKKENSPQAGCSCKCLNRRAFIMAGVGGLLATSAGGIFASMRSLYPTINYEPSLKAEIGLPEEFAGVSMKQVQIGGSKISILKGDNGLYALVRNCTHMGCIPYLDNVEQLFRCPCHGSVFTLEGDVVKGPAPEPLYRASITVNPRGRVEINGAVIENDINLRSKPPFSLKV